MFEYQKHILSEEYRCRMGQKSSKEPSIDTSQLIKDRYSKVSESSIESSKILLVQQRNLSYFLCCCNCCGLIEAEVVEMQLTWIQYIQRKLESQKFFGWYEPINEALINHELSYHFEDNYALNLNEIRMIISYYETNRFLNNSATASHASKFQGYEEEEANTIFEDRKKSGASEKEFFRQIMSAINTQIKHESHPCFAILKQFQNYIVNYNGSQVWFRNSFKKSNHKDQLFKSTELCDEIIEFIKYLVNALDSYYMLDKLVKSDNLLKCFTETNMLSFVISVLFIDCRVYNKVFDSFAELFKEENQDYERNLKLFQHRNITEFEIKEELQLNMSETELESQHQPLIDNPSIQNSIFQQFNIPYSSAISTLRQLQVTQSPTNQLKVISKTYKEIDKNINDYFSKHPNAPAVKSYGTDDIVPILTYVIAKSEIENFGIILKLIEAFTPKQIMTGILGYYLVTIQGCYMRIQNYHKIEYNRNSIKKFYKSSTFGQQQLSQLHKFKSADNVKSQVQFD